MTNTKTFYDIAEEANLSTATVSRYFNNPDIVSEKTKNNIEAAIEKIGYKRNKLASTLARGKSNLIGIIVPNLKIDFYSMLLTALLDYAESLGYNCLVLNSNGEVELESKYIKQLQAYQVVGIVNYSNILDEKTIFEMNPNTVVIERCFDYLKSVSSNNAKGGILAFNHLSEINCDVFITLNSAISENPVYNRTTYFLNEAKKNHKIVEYIETPFSVENYQQNVELINDRIDYLLSTYPNQKIGVFVASDYFANIFKNCARNRGISIPDTFAIIGFDDSPLSRMSSMPMTTIRQDIEKISKTAIDLLFTDEDIHKEIDVELIIRDTTVKQNKTD